MAFSHHGKMPSADGDAAVIEIVKVEKDGSDGILVTFSDGTTAGYVVEELLAIRPIREQRDGYLIAPFSQMDPD